MKYRDAIPRLLAPGWLQTPKNAAWLRASGDLKDSLVERAKAAVKARFPLLAPRDALDSAGAERQLERGPSETNESFAARVVGAWNIWRWGGTAGGLLHALADSGYPDAILAIVGGKAYALVDGEVTTTTLPAGSWACAATPTFWSRFVVVLPANPWGEDPASDDPRIELIRRLVRRWKSAFSTCTDIAVLNAGRMWDWPLTTDGSTPRTWDAQEAAGWTWGDTMTVLHYSA